MDALGQSYHLALYMVENLLHVTEQYFSSREFNIHKGQLTQEPVPLIHTNPLLDAGYGGEDLPESVFPVRGQVQRHFYGF